MEPALTGPTHWMLASGLLIGRLVIGTLMIAHSGQKLFGWLDGDGLGGTAGFLEQIGFQPGLRFAAAAATAELLSGMLLVLGLFGPVGPALLISVMLVAAVSVHHGNGLFATTNGIEVPLLYATAGLAFALVGYGPLSLDMLLGLDSLWTPSTTLVVIALGILLGIASLALRRRRLARASGQSRLRVTCDR